MSIAVKCSQDYARIAALPRRRLTLADAEAWAAVLTRELRRPGAHGALRPWQAIAMVEALENRGALLVLPVGTGKTLITFALPYLFGATRPVLIVPANLREKTAHEFAVLGKTWRGNPPTVLSRQSLALEQNATLIERLNPDLIMIDEADDMAHDGRAAPKRLARFKRRVGEGCPVVALTGTLANRSINEYRHMLLWALGDAAPVPLDNTEAESWAAVLDETRGVWPSVDPGPLGRDRESARAWYRTRLAETPGVVIIDEDSAADIPLTVRLRPALEDPELDVHFARFLAEGENPGGQPVSDPLSRWRADGELGCCFYRYWDPPPPDEWRDARRAFAKFVRTRIEYSQRSHRPLETEAQVVRAYPEAPEVKRWLEVRPMFDAHVTKIAWVGVTVIHSVRAWLRESADPAIVWTGNVPIAERLADALALPYYGRDGKDAKTGRALHSADTRQSLIVSISANKKGFNLQPWARQLLLHPPPSSKWWEQILGRSHRQGQTRPVVADVLCTSGGTYDAFDDALEKARAVQAREGQTQKILRATVERIEPTITASNKYRWARKERK